MNRFLVSEILTLSFRWLVRIAVVLGFGVLLAMLGTRYLLLPNIDHFRPWIVDKLSETLDMEVRLDALHARWQGGHPHIDIRGLAVTDHDGQQVLELPKASAVLSWRSLWTAEPHFVSLQARGLDLTLQRERRREVAVMGVQVPIEPAVIGRLPLDKPAMKWLLAQPNIVLHDSSLLWLDDVQDAPPVAFNDVTLRIVNESGRHEMGLVASSELVGGGLLDVRARLLPRKHSDPGQAQTVDGQLYVRVDHLVPAAWQRWTSWAGELSAKKIAAQAWLDVEAGHISQVTADVDLDEADLYQPGQGRLTAEQARVFIRGPLSILEKAGEAEVRMQGQGMALSALRVPDMPLAARRFSAQGQVQVNREESELSLELGHLMLDNPDVQATGQLAWMSSSDGPGHLDMSLDVPFARVGAIHRYMPQQVDEVVRTWLQNGLTAGRVSDATVLLQGELRHFPFDRSEHSGNLVIEAPFQATTIDYLPQESGYGDWPALYDIDGHATLQNTSLTVRATDGKVKGTHDESVHLQDVQAHIANMKQQPVLLVAGTTKGDAAAYLDFYRHSALADMLDHVFDETTVSGAWTVPLGLTVPLSARGGNTQVRGQILMDGASVQLTSLVPSFQGLTGAIAFTEDHASVSELAGQFLGGPIQFSGGLGASQTGMKVKGRVTAQALAQRVALAGMKRLSGHADYTATLTGVGPPGTGHPELDIQSSLTGLGMDFPAPMGKNAESARDLRVSWRHDDRPGARRLDVNLDDLLAAKFVHTPQADSDAWFEAGSISVGQKAQWPERGLSAAVELPSFDLDAWDTVIREFSASETEAGQASASSAQQSDKPLFPKVRQFQAQTQKGRLLGMDMDNLSYRVWQDGALDWRADIHSDQAVGELGWMEIDGEIDGPIHAVFEQLEIGEPEAARTTEEDEQSAGSDSDRTIFKEDLQVPPVSLSVNQLSLYGVHVGSLELEGVPDDQGQAWELETFELVSPDARTSGEGKWQLRGPTRGIRLDTQTTVSDMGAWMDQMGFEDVMSGGQGDIQASMQWFDLPWSMDERRIDGQVQFDLADGRLSTVNSDAARLLELVSLQSMKRLTKLDINPVNITRDGFPFDVLRGTLEFDQGKLRTDDYQVAGPVGSIVVDGGVELGTGALNLDAVVVPNLDVSGAAIAAGIVVNPVVGLGAFLTQWVLKEPVAEALAARYQIRGTWQDPDIKTRKKLRSRDKDPVSDP